MPWRLPHFILSLHGAPKTMHRIYSRLSIVTAVTLAKRRVIMNSLHMFLFLRPLIVLVMVCLTVIISSLLSLLKKCSEAEDCDKTHTDQSPSLVLSIPGTWCTGRGGRTQSAPANETESPTQKRAA